MFIQLFLGKVRAKKRIRLLHFVGAELWLPSPGAARSDAGNSPLEAAGDPGDHEENISIRQFCSYRRRKWKSFPSYCPGSEGEAFWGCPPPTAGSPPRGVLHRDPPAQLSVRQAQRLNTFQPVFFFPLSSFQCSDAPSGLCQGLWVQSGPGAALHPHRTRARRALCPSPREMGTERGEKGSLGNCSPQITKQMKLSLCKGGCNPPASLLIPSGTLPTPTETGQFQTVA